jgi:hypothetical protein
MCVCVCVRARVEAKNTPITTAATMMKSELHLVTTTSSALKMLWVTTISVDISSVLSVNAAVPACKNVIPVTDTVVHAKLQNVQVVVMCTCPLALSSQELEHTP